MLIAVGIAFFLLAMALMAAGLRGRRIDDHPHCRRCGFDLTGTPASSTRCSECGTDLTRRHAIQLGLRKRRHDLMLAGALFLILAAVPATLMFSGVDGYRYTPSWLLERDTRTISGDIRAWPELTRRVRGGTLARETVTTLADRVLAWQANPQVMWQPAWGDFVEASRAAGMVSDQRWQTYARNAPSIAIRNVTRNGDKLFVTLAFRNHRAGGRNLQLLLGRRAAAGELIRPGWEIDAPGFFNIFGNGASSLGFEIELDRDAVAQATPGKRDLRLTLDLAMFEKQNSPLIVNWTQTFDSTWNFAPTTTQP